MCQKVQAIVWTRKPQVGVYARDSFKISGKDIIAGSHGGGEVSAWCQATLLPVET